MKQRLKFECWNCQRVFSLFLETEEKPDRISECPFCRKEVFIELEPYREKKTSLFRSDTEKASELPHDFVFPEVIPTQQPVQQEPPGGE